MLPSDLCSLTAFRAMALDSRLPNPSRSIRWSIVHGVRKSLVESTTSPVRRIAVTELSGRLSPDGRECIRLFYRIDATVASAMRELAAMPIGI